MTRLESYKKEVELACKRERESENNPNGWSYGCFCYESAFKAFKSLCEDNHDRNSWLITNNILMRMCNGLPLTSIKEEDFKRKDGYYLQCPRMSSLFRYEQQNGKVIYSDKSRYYCFEKNNPEFRFRQEGFEKILDEIFPIVLPYYPTIEKYKICAETHLKNSKNSNCYTRAIWWVITPRGKKVEINRFFTFMETDMKWVEITKDEYDKLRLSKID